MRIMQIKGLIVVRSVQLVQLLFLIVFCCFSCYESAKKPLEMPKPELLDAAKPLLQNNTIKTRFSPPSGFTRSKETLNSFQQYLRNLALKPEGALVNYYDGATKNNHEVYEAVIDLKIGNKDLHQCADAVMRLRAEYLWRQERYEEIHFNFTNGHKVEYKEWMLGKRMHVKGNKTSWKQKAAPSNTYGDFWDYMELIFMYAGTASLEKELISTPIDQAQIGDVFIQGGYPGHAVIIVDKAIKSATKESVYLIAQSYMPAQEIQVLINPTDMSLSPWYSLKVGDVTTPEWAFTSDELKRFE